MGITDSYSPLPTYTQRAYTKQPAVTPKPTLTNDSFTPAFVKFGGFVSRRGDQPTQPPEVSLAAQYARGSEMAFRCVMALVEAASQEPTLNTAQEGRSTFPNRLIRSRIKPENFAEQFEWQIRRNPRRAAELISFALDRLANPPKSPRFDTSQKKAIIDFVTQGDRKVRKVLEELMKANERETERGDHGEYHAEDGYGRELVAIRLMHIGITGNAVIRLYDQYRKDAKAANRAVYDMFHAVVNAFSAKYSF